MHIIIFNIILLFSLCIHATDPKTAPGSRTIYISYIDEKNIELKLRKCVCGEKTTNTDLCACWFDASPEDQPAIQGRPLFIGIFSGLEPRYGLILSDKEEASLRFPHPEFFIKILRETNLSNGFSYNPLKEIVSEEEFISLVRKGLLPLASFDANNNTPMQYHSMLHDLDNHLCLRLFLPKFLECFLFERIDFIFSLIEELTTEVQDDSEALCIFELIQSAFAKKIDVCMGTLNNNIFQNLANFSYNPDLSHKERIETLKKVYPDNLQTHLEKLLNFGLTFSDLENPHEGAMTFECRNYWAGRMIMKDVYKIKDPHFLENFAHPKLCEFQKISQENKQAIIKKTQQLLVSKLGVNQNPMARYIFSIYDLLGAIQNEINTKVPIIQDYLKNH